MIFVGVTLLVFFIAVLIIKPKCPVCGGKLHFEFEDLAHGCIVYRCDKCGEEWI